MEIEGERERRLRGRAGEGSEGIKIRTRGGGFTLEGAYLSVSSNRPKAGHAGMQSSSLISNKVI